MGNREDLMRYHGVFTCPDWCAQPAGEDQTECHSPDRDDAAEVVLAEGSKLRVRPWLSWWSDVPDPVLVEIEVTPIPENRATNSIVLTPEDTTNLQAAIDTALAYCDAYGEQWAYDGAEQDAAAAGGAP